MLRGPSFWCLKSLILSYLWRHNHVIKEIENIYYVFYEAWHWWNLHLYARRSLHPLRFWYMFATKNAIFMVKMRAFCTTVALCCKQLKSNSWWFLGSLKDYLLTQPTHLNTNHRLHGLKLGQKPMDLSTKNTWLVTSLSRD